MGIPVPVMYQERMMPKKQTKSQKESERIVVSYQTKNGYTGVFNVKTPKKMYSKAKIFGKALELAEDGLKATGKGIKKVWKKITKKNKPVVKKTIRVISFDKLPSNVKEMYRKYERAGWKGNVSGQTSGTKAGSVYKNRDGKLPQNTFSGEPITYREFDINNKIPGQERDKERFVIGSNGSKYYTDDHYTTFKRIMK